MFEFLAQEEEIPEAEHAITVNRSEEPDTETFPGLALAYRAAKCAGSMPTVFNAANEMAVKLLLEKKIRFAQIPELIEAAMNHHRVIGNPDLEEILETEAETYEFIRHL